MNKLRTFDDLADAAAAASSVSFGGGGHVRKPLAAAAAIGLATGDPLDVRVLLGGPEVDLLIGRGRVRSLLFAFMGMGPSGLCPNFRRAREEDTGLEAFESSESLVLAGLTAAARDLPFVPVRAGLGTDVLTRPNTPYRTITCPFTGDPLVAVPAINVDLAVLHVNVADVRGNCLVYGDIFGDYLLARAANKKVWVTAEQVVDELPPIGRRPHNTFLSRLMVAGVIPAPGGSCFTSTFPDRMADDMGLLDYQRNATDPVWLERYCRDLLKRVEGEAA
jgi:glutaconate CoA-transferase subunit A